MGFLSRVPVQQDGRRAAPATGQSTKRGGTPKGMKRVRRAVRRLRKKAQRITRSLTTNNSPNKSPNKSKAKGSKPVAVYHHGTCTVNHRSRKTAAKCRRSD
jgi:hypothetical protein